jgi:alkyldihydroxyacetonephosphate synthase
VHRVAERKGTFGYLFPNFASGMAAMRQCQRDGCVPVLARLNDPNKTALSFAFRRRSSAVKHQASRLLRLYLRRVRGFDLDRVCLMLTGFEGTRAAFDRDRSAVEKIYRQHGAVSLGAEPGRAFEKGKYDFPYLRDFLLDRGVVSDVSETAAVWSRLPAVYETTYRAIQAAIAREGARGWVGCHISHTYHSGASLYFTFAFTAPGREEDVLPQYLRVKKASEDAFIASGATLSHHHGVGYEHLPWLERDVSPAGMAGLRALKQGLDRDDVMNPGKLGAGLTFAEWGLPDEELERQ